LRFVACGERADGLAEHRAKRREGVTEKAGYAQGNVDAGTVEVRQRQDLDARDAVGLHVPYGLRAEQVERHRELLAGCPHRRGSPEIYHEVAGIVAVVL
jgi:hypothetical protein